MAIQMLCYTAVTKTTRRELLAVFPALYLVNCSSNPTAKVPEAPPTPVTGLHGLYQMYTYARSWVPDLKVIRLTSRAVSEVITQPGKAAAWQVQFASESLGKTRGYTFSVYDESTTLRQGIFADPPGDLTKEIHSFVIGDAATDSDKALEIAKDHGSKYAAQHPDMPISYMLDADPLTNAPVWRVIWGASISSSNYSVLVDAQKGNYIRTLF